MAAARLSIGDWKCPLRPEYKEWFNLMTENASLELTVAKWLNHK